MNFSTVLRARWISPIPLDEFIRERAGLFGDIPEVLFKRLPLLNRFSFQAVGVEGP